MDGGQCLQAVDPLDSSNHDLAVLTNPGGRYHHHSLLEGCATDVSALELRIRAVHEVLARPADEDHAAFIQTIVGVVVR